MTLWICGGELPESPQLDHRASDWPHLALVYLCRKGVHADRILTFSNFALSTTVSSQTLSLLIRPPLLSGASAVKHVTTYWRRLWPQLWRRSCLKGLRGTLLNFNSCFTSCSLDLLRVVVLDHHTTTLKLATCVLDWELVILISQQVRA